MTPFDHLTISLLNAALAGEKRRAELAFAKWLELVAEANRAYKEQLAKVTQRVTP